MSTYITTTEDGLPMRSSGRWAMEKLDYLARYIDIFETSMRRKWSTRVFVDLFAGPGKNVVEETGEVFLGSPLIAMNTKFPFTGYIFCESDPANASALEQRCAISDLDTPVSIKHDDCNDVIDNVVEHLKQTDRNALNLAFLDPEGFELYWSTVEKLASIRRIDLIFNYPQSGLNRYMPEAMEKPEDTAIDLYFGTPQWRAVYESYQGRKGLHRELMDLYKSGLQKLGYRHIVRDDQTGDEPLIRNARSNSPLYRLMFASKNPLGQEFWRKITARNVHGQRRLF